MLNRKRNDNIEDIEIEIKQWKSQNLEKVEIILFPGEKEYLLKNGHTLVPLFYKIKDNNLENLKDCPNFIKEKYYKKNKKVIKLKKRERELLDSRGIEYEALGYIVYL